MGRWGVAEEVQEWSGWAQQLSAHLNPDHIAPTVPAAPWLGAHLPDLRQQGAAGPVPGQPGLGSGAESWSLCYGSRAGKLDRHRADLQLLVMSLLTSPVAADQCSAHWRGYFDQLQMHASQIKFKPRREWKVVNTVSQQ